MTETRFIAHYCHALTPPNHQFHAESASVAKKNTEMPIVE